MKIHEACLVFLSLLPAPLLVCFGLNGLTQDPVAVVSADVEALSTSMQEPPDHEHPEVPDEDIFIGYRWWGGQRFCIYQRPDGSQYGIPCDE